MRIKESERLIRGIFPEFDRKLLLADGKTFPSSAYELLPLTDFSVKNPRSYDISGCTALLPRQSIAKIKAQIRFEIQAPSPNGQFMLTRTPSGGKLTILLKGRGCRFLSMSAASMTVRAGFFGTSSLAIGENTFIGGGRIIMFGTDIVIGADGLWSDEVILQGSDQHGIIDLATRKVTNGGRKHIDIGRHVWVGRRAIVNKNVSIGNGAIIGTGAIVTKDVPLAAVAVGNPARVVKQGVTWVNKPDGPIAREIADIEHLRSTASNGSVPIAAVSRAADVAKRKGFRWFRLAVARIGANIAAKRSAQRAKTHQ